MATKLRSALGAIALLLIGLAFARPQNPARSERISSFLLSGPWLDRNHDDEVKSVFRDVILALFTDTMYGINQAYHRGIINVYVVEPDRLPTATLEQEAFAKTLRNNFLAVTPDVIVIDATLWTVLANSAFRHSVGLLQYSEAVAAAKAELQLQAEKVQPPIDLTTPAGPANVAERFRAINTYETTQLLSALHDSTSRSLIRRRAPLAREIWDGARRRVPHVAETFRRYLSTALGPIVAHEIAHLRSRRKGQLLSGGLLGLNRLLATQEEASADEVALSFLRRRAAELGFAESGRGRFEAEPMIWFSTTLRQIALVNLFSNFRGLAATEVLADIEVVGCGAPTLKFPGELPFWRSTLNYPPVPTTREWSSLRSRLGADKFSGHAPLLTRAEAVLGSLPDSMSLDPRILRSESPILLALANNDIDFYEIPPSPPLPVPSSRLRQLFEHRAAFEEAVNFSANRTVIAQLPEGGYVEIRSAAPSSIEYAHMLLLVPGTSTPEEAAISATNSAAIDAALNIVASHVPGSAGYYEYLAQGVLTCRWESRQVDIDGIGVRLRRLNDSPFLSLEIMDRLALPPPPGFETAGVQQLLEAELIADAAFNTARASDLVADFARAADKLGAALVLRRRARDFPNNNTLALLHYRRGEAQLRIGRYAEAAADYSEGIRLDAEVKNATAAAFLQRGAAYEGLGDFLAARTDYERALDLRPELDEARAHLRRLGK